MEKFLKYKNKTVYILLALIILVGGFLLYRSHSSATSKTAVIQKQNQTKQIDTLGFSFVPSTITVASDKDFSIDVAIDPDQHKVTNADLIFTYDKTKLRLDSISGSGQFSQVLYQSTTSQGVAAFSAATGFGSSISSKATYATLHFHSLAAAENSPITIDQQKSGIYADDNAGVNNLGTSLPALVSVTN